MAQEIYNTLEQFYVNYAGGQVDDAPFDKQYPTIPADDRKKLQEAIINKYGITNPTLHASWITKNKLGPVFMYRTQPSTVSTLYPGMTVNVQGNEYTVGAELPCNKDSIRFFVIGDDGEDINFMNKQKYSTANQEQVNACKAAVEKMLSVIDDGDTLQSVPVKTKVIYAKAQIAGDTFPEIVAEEPDKSFSVTSLLGQG